jgi:nitroreductase
MNIVTTIIKSRHSVRKFKPGALDENAIRDAIECAALAPTARNVQPWVFGVLKDKPMLAKIADLAPNGSFIKDCTVCFAIFGKKTEEYYLEDCCAATENLILALQAHGIASCWVAGDKKPYAETIRTLLRVPESYTLVAMVAAGLPAEVTIAPKKDLKKISFFETYEEK